jgi:hypothetical protein
MYEHTLASCTVQSERPSSTLHYVFSTFPDLECVVNTSGPHGMKVWHLYDGLAEKYHLLSYFFDYKVLDLEPFLVFPVSIPSTQLDFPNGILLVSSGTSYRLMDYVCDKIIDRRWTLLSRAQICGG